MDESAIRWIRDDVVLAVHRRQLAEHGGADGVRDQGLLDSALERPRNLPAYGDPAPDLPLLAAAYAFGIASNHPFIDGNKRNALVVCVTFLLLNGLELTASDQDAFGVFMKLTAGEISESALAQWLRETTRAV